ncbi:hypothetical protein QYM36_015206 [Artemia franciscana]|nr:hypothetical protein QYM36_015206 [Artemia franciscana]KAK2707434.1 hypothetical protein QYM36_015206 [Artemia franciscana]
MKFHGGLNIDFDKWPDLSVKMERENNMREFKTLDDDMPKFGAGSEFGKEAREEARRKKYGINLRKYKPDDQPWIMKVGSGKTARKYKGTREGGITENASYYILTPGKNNSFEAHPVKEWYNFIPIQRYQALNEEEAEEQFNRRDKTLNYFAVMVNKKITGKTGENVKDEDEQKKKTKGKALTFNESDIDESGGEGGGEDFEGSDEETKKPQKGKKKKERKDSGSEAEEDEGDGDNEGAEVDYMSSSDQESESETEELELKGVSDEAGLRGMLTSEEDSDEEKKSNEDESEEEEEDSREKIKKKKEKRKKLKEEATDSSTTDSEDEEQQKRKAEKKAAKADAALKVKEELKAEPEPQPSEVAKPESRKRPHEGYQPPPKHIKTEAGTPGPSSSGQFTEGLNEETLRRYLSRKPMTAVDLLSVFRRKAQGKSKEDLAAAITELLKKVDPKKTKHQGKTYFALK